MFMTSRIRRTTPSAASSEVFRSSEVQVTQLGVGGDFHFDNVRARPDDASSVLYSQTTPRQ